MLGQVPTPLFSRVPFKVSGRVTIEGLPFKPLLEGEFQALLDGRLEGCLEGGGEEEEGAGTMVKP